MDDREEGEFGMGELIDKASRRLTTAVLMAGGLIAISIYAKPEGPHYSVAAADGRVIRVNSRNGAMVSCGNDGCITIRKPGAKVHVGFGDGRDKPAALPSPAAPTPQAAPSAPAQPAALPR
jgi:hypothetical protein